MQVAITNFAKLAAGNKIICLGGMKELGEATFNEHQALINQMQQFTWTKVILVGDEFKNCTHPYQFFESVATAKIWLKDQNFVHHTILIKGSRGIQMEQLIAD
jgi:UDP-N-acetylmuramoyl-tripeptide--D-alanyl-D-alanine ligase